MFPHRVRAALATNPAPGDRIDLYASVTGGDAFGLGPLDVWVAIFTAFNDTLSGALPMVQISSDQYGVRLLPFHDGTAVTLHRSTADTAASGL